MPLDLDAIRARHEPYADTRVGQDIAALLSELGRLRSELAAAQSAREQLRARVDLAEAILAGILPGPVSDALIDARNHESRTEGVSAAADWGRTVGRAQVMAAAQPVVEWEDHPQVGLLGEDRSWSVAERGYFRLWVDVDGWHLLCSLPDMPANRSIASGSETGPAGKSAAEAAYRKAAGL